MKRKRAKILNSPSNRNSEQFFENAYCQLWIENGILYVMYRKGLYLRLEDAKIIVADRLKFQQGVVYPAYCDFQGVIRGDKAARDYLANEGSAMVSAIACHITSPAVRIITNIYVTFSRPKVITRMFSKKEYAISFLKKFVVTNNS